MPRPRSAPGLVRPAQLPDAELAPGPSVKAHLDAVRARLGARGAGVVAEDVLAPQVFGDGAEDGAEVVLGARVERGARVAHDEELPARLLGQIAEPFGG